MIKNKILEIASNDGYLLEIFDAQGYKTLGVEPTKLPATICKSKGISVIEDFFGRALSEEISRKYGKAKLIIGNNVLAHVPDLNDFVAGIKTVLAETGVATFE